MPKEKLKIPKSPQNKKGPYQNKKGPYQNKKGSCPPGFKWDEKKGKCVQKGVGKEYKP